MMLVRGADVMWKNVSDVEWIEREEGGKGMLRSGKENRAKFVLVIHGMFSLMITFSSVLATTHFPFCFPWHVGLTFWPCASFLSLS